MYDIYYNSPYLMHHGIKGMHWGIRRYQNRDGSLTSAGRTRYGDGLGRRSRRGSKKPLTAAQKAERKRKLIKGAKIAAAALGTAAVVGGTAYAMKKGAAAQDKFMQGLVDSARRSEVRRRAEQSRRTMDDDRRDANQSFKDFNRRAGDANRSLGAAEARVREYREGIRNNMRQLDELDNAVNQLQRHGNFTQHRMPTAEEIARSRANDERDKAERIARSREYTTPSNTSPYHDIGAMWTHGAEEQYRRDHRR